MLCLVAVGLTPAAHGQLLYESYLEPAFVGGADTELSWWDVFYAANNSVGNFPDVLAPFGGGVDATTGDRVPVARSTTPFATSPAYSPGDPLAFWDARNATVKQTTSGGFIVGVGTTGNIYSFSEATQFVLEDTTPYAAGTVVFQFQTAGSTVDFAGVRLNYQSASGPVALAPDEAIKEFGGSDSSFGGIGNRTAMQWNLTGRGVTSYTITFAATEASLSLQEVLLDTAQAPGVVVPPKRAWVGGSTGIWSAAGNWSGGSAPGAGANVTLTGGAAVTLDGSRAVGELILDGPNGTTLTAAGAAELTINTGITASGAAPAVHTINAPVVMGGLLFHEIGAGQTVVLGRGMRTGEYSDGADVTGGFVKRGPGTLVIDGDIAAGVAGSVQVATGALEIAPGRVVSGSGAWQAAAGTTLRVDGTLGGAGALTLEGATLTGAGSVGRAVTIDAGDRVAPGAGVGTLQFTGAQTWGGGGAFDWQIGDAAGDAGTGWDLAAITGALSVTATAANPFTIFVTGVSLAGFDPGVNGAWTIATATAGVAGFSAEKFAIDLTGWSGGGGFGVALAGTALQLTYTAVPEPGALALLVVAGGLALVAGRNARKRN